MSSAVYSLQVGSPISNCGQGNTANITSSIAGQLTLGETWSVDYSVGLDIGELDLKLDGPSITWSQTQSSTVGHTISIQVAPGQIVCTNIFPR
jgi:hypothetical protein